MLFCFIVLALVTGWTLLVGRANVFLVLMPVFFVLVVFAGVRDENVGTDTRSYVSRFEKTSQVVIVKDTDSFSFLDVVGNVLSAEVSYSFVIVIAHLISDKYPALLFLIAAIVVGCYMVSFKSCSDDVGFSVFLMITLGFYFLFFNIARQGIAMAIYSLSFNHLINHEFKKYCAYVILAATFHTTALIAIPLYFVFIRRNDYKTICIYGVLTILCGRFIRVVSSILSETVASRYSYFTDRNFSSGELYTIFFVAFAIAMYVSRRYIEKENQPVYDVWLNMIVVGAILYITVWFADMDQNAQRLGQYFLIGICYAVPMVMSAIKQARFGFFVKTTFLVLCVVYYYLIIPRMGLDGYELNEWLR